MQDTLIKWFMRFNAFVICASHGGIGSKLGTQTILLLETVGGSQVGRAKFRLRISFMKANT